MDETKNILLVTNAINDTDVNLIKEAISNAQSKNLRLQLHLVHVIPNLPTCYFNIPAMVNLTEEYYGEAKNCLTSIGDLLDIQKRNQWLITGRIKTEVLRLANKLNSRFILASSTNIQELNKSFTPKKENKLVGIRNVNNIGTL